MKKEFIPYKQALELKELGFDRSCFGWYESERSPISVGESWRSGQNSIASPTFSQAFKWFRKKYDLNSHIHQEDKNNYSYCCGQGYSDEIDGYQDFETYEEAEFECLKKLIEIVNG